MHKVLSCTIVCLVLFLCSCQKDTVEIRSNEAMVASKAKVQKTAGEQTVRFIYLVPSDREFNRDYYNAIRKTAQTIQKWYAEQLDGYTFHLNKPIVEVLESDQPAA